MANRIKPILGLALVLLGGCEEVNSGPLVVSAIGSPPTLANPNLKPLDPASAMLIEAVAQGLVRFDPAGQIEPALAERWIVSDDGLHYVFRLKRAEWQGGGRITAEQVAERLRAAYSRSSRNPHKPILGAIDEIVAMTDEVLEISLKSPRPNFLQLLAQPELGVIRGGRGSGPYRAGPGEAGAVALEPMPGGDEEEAEQEWRPPPVLLRGERAAMAVARFEEGQADLVVGGTAGDLPLARAANLPANRLAFDPVAGLFGLAFVRREGPLADPAARRALAMAVDRGAIVAALAVPGLAARDTLFPSGVQELPRPAPPGWSLDPFPMRREFAARTLSGLAGAEPFTVKVAMPDGPGYRLVFAHLRRDWRMIGVDARPVSATEEADLHFIDAVAPANLASWYLRIFACEGRFVCDPAADEMMAAARIAATAPARRELLANADRILADTVPFIPIAAPIRWSLVSPRVTGFRPNIFGRHAAGELVAPAP